MGPTPRWENAEKKILDNLCGEILFGTVSDFMMYHTSTSAGLKSGQSNRINNLTKCNFIFLTGSTGWTGYNHELPESSTEM
jgi:hypothetical protein